MDGSSVAIVEVDPGVVRLTLDTLALDVGEEPPTIDPGEVKIYVGTVGR
jgi:hypothetical protein